VLGTYQKVGNILGPNGSITLAGLTGDTLITTPASGQILTYNGTKWVNTTPASGGGSMPTYTISGTLTTPHQVIGQVTITGVSSRVLTSSTITLTGAAAFTGATTYLMTSCTPDGSSFNLSGDVGSTNPSPFEFNTVQSSGTSFVITAYLSGSTTWSGTGPLVLNYILSGY
jgi:hypothetical protein